jgi:ribosomal protein L11 methyltransferase
MAGDEGEMAHVGEDEGGVSGELSWMEVRVLVPEADPLALEPLEEALLAVAPFGFATEAWDAPPTERGPVPPGWIRYLVYVGEQELEATRLALEAAIAPWPGAHVASQALTDGWRDRWKAWYHPVPCGERLIVTPPWHREGLPEDRVVLVIEPGMAFGTAQHETTALCLAGIERLYAEQAAGMPRMLDVGCGTGVLALGAAAFGAREAYGIDIDPQAPRSARENLALNTEVVAGCDLRFDTTPVEAVPDAWDLVAANVLTPTLLTLAAPIAARVRAAGGRLMLSGILVEQAGDIVARYEAEGLRHLGTEELRGWVRVDFVRD